MGGKKTTTNTYSGQQTAAPPSWTMPGITDASAKVTQALQSLPAAPYTGNFVAQRDPAETAKIQGLYGSVQNQASGMQDFLTGQLPTITQAPTFATSANGTGMWNAPDPHNLDAAIGAAIHPVMQQLMTQVLPSIKSSALESGAYTGDRAMGVMPTQAIDNANEASQRIAATLGYEDYQARTNRDLQAFEAQQQREQQAYGLDTNRQLGVADLLTSRLGMLPQYTQSIMQMAASQPDLAKMASDLGLMDQQAGIDNALQRYNFDIQQPFMGLDIASELLARLSGSYGTQTSSGTSKTVEKTGGLGNVVQGALGLASMAAGFPGLGGALGGLAGAAAPVAGGAASNLFASAVPQFNPFTNPFAMGR